MSSKQTCITTARRNTDWVRHHSPVFLLNSQLINFGSLSLVFCLYFVCAHMGYSPSPLTPRWLPYMSNIVMYCPTDAGMGFVLKFCHWVKVDTVLSFGMILLSIFTRPSGNISFRQLLSLHTPPPLPSPSSHPRKWKGMTAICTPLLTMSSVLFSNIDVTGFFNVPTNNWI